MQELDLTTPAPVTRRDFLKKSSLATATAAAAVSFPTILHAQNKQTINAIIIGIGGRGGQAGKDFLEGAKAAGVEAKVVAVADLFAEQANRGMQYFSVPADKCFSGFDAYQKALAVPEVNYAILATPPGFRAVHFKACVDAGKNIFTEKPVCVDGVGARIMYAAAEEAKQKGLKVAAGTQRRHRPSYQETVKRIQDGAIGDITDLRAYWVNGGAIWHDDHKARYGQRKGDTVLEKQLNNWYHYIWLCGDHCVEQQVHNIDVCNWIAGGHPVKAWGMGARQQLGDKPGEIWDNFAMEYEYANGVRMHGYSGQITRAWSSVSEAVVGSKGTAELFDGRNSIKPKDGTAWRTKDIPNDNGYVNEHTDLINAIVHDTPMNEAKQVTDSTLTAVMGREAAYSGGLVEWNDILECKFAYGPPELYSNLAGMKWGDFRTLKPPMPGSHNIFKEKVELPTV